MFVYIVDSAIKIQLNASRVRGTSSSSKYQHETPMTHKYDFSPRTATNTLDSGTPSSATPAPQSIRAKHNKNKSRLGLNDNPSNATMLIHEETSTVPGTVTPTTRVK